MVLVFNLDQDKFIPYEINQVLIKNDITDLSVYAMKLPSSTLEPNTTIRIPIFIRGDRIGKHSFSFLFSYESDQKTSRSLKLNLNVTVNPSLRINAFTRPSSKILNEFIVGLEVENLLNYPIILNQLTATSSKWVIKNVDKMYFNLI